MKELSIAAATLRRTLRDRSSIFFLVLFPMLMILVLGTAFGGSYTPKVGVVEPGSPLAAGLAASLRAAPGIRVEPAGDATALIAAVERGELEAGVVLPADVSAPVRYVVRPGLTGQQVGSIVTAALERENGRLRAVTFVQARTGITGAEAQARVDAAARMLPSIPVTLTSTGAATTAGRFDGMAGGQLLLFVFLAAMTSSVALVESRRLGVTRRMLATPTSTGQIIRGEALGRLAVALLQAVIIMAGSALLFGVGWGDPLAAGLLVTAFAAVASAVGMLLGASVRSSELAIGTGLLLSLAMAALGGSMMPLELFSPTMRDVAHLTPHAWAAEGLAELTRHGGALADVTTHIGVLSAAAVVLFAGAAWVLRRRITH